VILGQKMTENHPLRHWPRSGWCC